MQRKGFLATILLLAILMGTTGCPTTQSYQATYEDLQFDFSYSLKGLCLFWFRDVIVLNPDIIYITIPHLTSFNWTPGVIGNFGINNDQQGPPEFLFNVISNGSFAFIDFDFSNTFTGGDIRIDWNSSLSRFEINHPFGGLGVLPGFYWLQFLPGLLPVSGDDACWDVTVEMQGDGPTVKRNKLLCMNSCIMPILGFADLSGLALGTDYVLYNVNAATNRIKVKYYDQVGNPTATTIGTTTSETHIFSLDPHTSLRLRPSVDTGVSGVKVLWALAYGQWPITCALDFTARDGEFSAAALPAGAPATTVLGEAGIAASGVDTFHILNIVKRSNANPDLAIDTSLALANPTSAPATITARLLDENDQQVATATLDVLPAKNGRSVFFSQIFANFTQADFDGTLILNSDTEIGVATLQTNGGGVQQASLPSANRQVP